MSKKKQSIFDRLTDHNLYTGSHKNRFDKDGNGRGIAGRDTGAVGRGSNNGWHGERFKEEKKSTSMKRKTSSTKKKVSGVTGPKKKVVKKKKKSPSPSTTSTKKRRVKKSGNSIFDRLTDSSQYTGSHKHRFDKEGRGRGISGRDVGKNGQGSNRGSPW